ncbi:hypothetical protein NP233_g7055 [Leucocoprinus birnbaumii]|uniref:Uncharacterized protein n=1 Tax=Leucocoprinus birnbaumii TaxID=56174 RepID=A0AAD5YT52_9AGAR|nr:hypothetical protein NP233_g7055 [Leucocoprinus birnbaumii]
MYPGLRWVLHQHGIELERAPSQRATTTAVVDVLPSTTDPQDETPPTPPPSPITSFADLMPLGSGTELGDVDSYIFPGSAICVFPDDIVAAFTDPSASEITHQIRLVISPELNPQIRLFFTEKLAEIRDKRRIEVSWPTVEDIVTLVDLSSGLFAHSQALVLFIDDPDSEGPQHQLRIVMSYADKSKHAVGKHPLAALDFFYDTLVLKRIPDSKRKSIRLMLLVWRLLSRSDLGSVVNALTVGAILEKAEDQIRDLCRSLHPVMTLNSDLEFIFYHSSFLDFLEDERRSKDECIRSDSAVKLLLNHVLPMLSNLCVGGGQDSSNLQPPTLSSVAPDAIHTCLVALFFGALGSMSLSDLHGVDVQILEGIREINFRGMAYLGRLDLGELDFDLIYLNLRKAGVVRPFKGRNLISRVRAFFARNTQYSERYFIVGRPIARALPHLELMILG